MTHHMTAKKQQRLVDEWNKAHEIGTPVEYWTSVREGEGHRGNTRSTAMLMGGHTAGVMIEHVAGFIGLSHVEALPPPKEEWAWMIADPDTDEAHGLFDSRDAAIENARKYLDPEHDSVIVVGQVEHIDPREWICRNLEDTLEDAENQAADNDWGDGCDDLFDIEGDRKEAAKELADVLEAWTSKWVTGLKWRLTDEGDHVELPAPTEPSGG